MKLSVRSTSGAKFDVEVDGSITVLELKGLLADESKIPAGEQRVIYKGRVLSDNGTLEHFGLMDGDAIHLVRNVSQTPQQQQGQGTGDVANGNPMMGEFGGIPGMEGMQNMLRQNPDFMQSMMNSPYMQSLMNNPEVLRSIMLSNPQMRSILESNPHLNHVLNDPELLRQSMNAARNPSVMQEMMRNQDRAMANIESLPGGYNALRRMYHDVQEPMMEAAEQAASNRMGTSQQQQDTDTNLGTGSAEPQSTPMPNPWGGGTGSNSQQRQGNASVSANSNAGRRPPPLFPMNSFNMGNGSDSTNRRSGVPMNNPFANFPMPPPEVMQSIMFGRTNQNSNPWGPSTTTNTSASSATTSSGPSMDGPNPWAPPTSADSPEQKYKQQLEQMENMGFPDKKANIQALLRTNGNVNMAVESLIEELSKE